VDELSRLLRQRKCEDCSHLIYASEIMGLFRAQRANCNPSPLNIEAPRRFGLDAARRIKKPV